MFNISIFSNEELGPVLTCYNIPELITQFYANPLTWSGEQKSTRGAGHST